MASTSLRRLGLAAGAVVVLAAGVGAAAYVIRGRDPLAAGRALQAKGDLRGAGLEFRNAVRAHPESAEAHWRLGAVLLPLGDPIAAEKELETAQARGIDPHTVVLPLAQSYNDQQRFADLLRDFPVDRATPEQAAFLLIARASAQLGLKDVDAAQASIDEAQRRAPSSPEVAYAAARVAANRKDYAAAERLVDRTLALGPHNAPAYLMKAELLNLRGDRAGSIAALDQSIAEQPKQPQARLARANLLMIAGQDAKARADVDAVIADAPKDPIGIYMRGVLQVRAKDYAGANVSFEQISTVINRIPRGLFFEAVTKLNLGQIEQALDAATRYVARNPADLPGLKLLAQVDLAAQRPDRAVEVLSRATGANNTGANNTGANNTGANNTGANNTGANNADAETLDMLGRAYAASGRQAQAVPAFERAATLAPRNSDILTRLASAKFGAGDAVGAADDFARSLEIAPNQPLTGERAVTAALAAGDVARAQAALDTLRRANANAALVGMLDGAVKAAQLDFPAARTAYAAVLRDDPKSVPARLGLAQVAQMLGGSDEAERLLREALALAPASEAALSRLLGVLLATGRTKEAIEVADAARKAAPDNTPLVTLLVDLAIGAGEPARGMTALDAVPKGRSNLPELQGARARVLVALGKPAEARQIYKQVLGSNPGDLDIRRQYLGLLISAGDLPAAREALREGLQVTPGNPGLLNASVNLAGRTDGIDAALAEADALARDPANAPASRELRGAALMAARRYDDAAAAYAAAAKAAPSTTLLVDTAKALDAAGKRDLAIRTLRDWVAARPDDLIALSALADFEIVAKRPDDAQPHLEAILAKQPRDPTALNNLAWIYQQKGDPRALALGQRSYLMAPTPQTADTLGWILTRQGKAEEGLPLLGLAFSGLRNEPTVAYHYAVALRALGRKDEAVRLLKLLTALPGAFDDKEAAGKLLAELSPQ